MTDNSYKLFVSPPTPGTPGSDLVSSRRTSEQRPKSTADLPSSSRAAAADANPQSQPTSRQVSEESTATHHHHHHHHHHTTPKSEPVSHAGPVSDSSSASTPAPTSTSSSQPIKGPWRLLRLLPRESRSIIGRMLEISPRKRATLEEVLSDPWVSGSAVCRQEDDGEVVKAAGHVHTLEPSAGVAPATGGAGGTSKA